MIQIEEGEHEDQVDSIQWCNTSQIRLLSGSSDGTARIWTYQGGRWNTIVLNMSQNDNRSSETANNVVSRQSQDVGQSYAQVIKLLIQDLAQLRNCYGFARKMPNFTFLLINFSNLLRP